MPCAPEDLPATYFMPHNAGWAGAGPIATESSRTVRYERDTAPIGSTWHYRYEPRP
jgi:hypothetical protein